MSNEVSHYLEPEMMRFVLSTINEKAEELKAFKPQHPSRMKLIAVRAVKEDKLQDENWLKEQFQLEYYISREIKKYSTKLINLTNYEMHRLADVFGPECFQFMVETLKDPAKIHPRWAAQYLATAKKLGFDKVKDSSRPYEFVTRNPIWKKYPIRMDKFYGKSKKKKSEPPVKKRA